MEETNLKEKKIDDKIITMNQIFDEVITDTQDFIQDLRSGIIMYFLMGLQCILMGILNLWSNRQDIASGDTLMLILSVLLVSTGPVIIYSGSMLRKKYEKLLEAGKLLNTV